MSDLTIRMSWQQLSVFSAVGFLIETVVALLLYGTGFIRQAWTDPIYWSVTIPVILLVTLIIWWAIPAAHFTKDGVSAEGYPFKVRWADIMRCQVSGSFGLIWLKIYGTKSRFPIWVPIPRNQIQNIHLFLQQENSSNAVLSAFSEPRLNQALQRTTLLPLGRR